MDFADNFQRSVEIAAIRLLQWRHSLRMPAFARIKPRIVQQGEYLRLLQSQ